ncbi:lysylphosphatidylglycerol synthase domain-containing protein [Bacillus tianshenii]|uniref:lysylphosphatidylglycerol synthase domain-containing protein n=1 Tax=Sutcliffiella tianshenii TaxID=1463404 RepID=UPI001CD39270|nr:lysylphosphatidylglycerol synthase domain-containing protein [Bacillus tianshenii]MCA1320690.1 lysylphosphatidylglycerol synthase domain-containing protein [Bacillus tianshenii]
MQLLKNTYFLRVLKVVFPLTILILIYIEGKKQIKSVNISLVIQKIQEIGLPWFLWLLLLGVFAVATMILYDVYLIRRLNVHLPKWKVFVQGFSANAYANFWGFGGFAGVGLRTLYYRRQSANISFFLKSVTILLPYMLVGLSIFAWMVLVNEWYSPIVLHNYPIIKLPLLIMCGYGIFIVAAGYYTKRVSNHTQLTLVTISLLEWGLAAFLFFQISLALNVHMHAHIVILLFFMAAISGVLSTVPGGVGAFDFVILVGMASFGNSEEKALALLFLYRLVYYVIPFLISTLLLGHFLYKEKIWRSIIPNKEAFSSLCHRILSVWVLVVGVLLLLFPVVPAFIQRVKLADQFLSMEMLQISQQFSIAIGIILLVLSRAIEDKVRRAYYFTFFVLIIGMFVSFSKGFHMWEVVLLLGALFLLYGSKREFYRHVSQYNITKVFIDGFILFCISLLYVLVGSLQIAYLRKMVPGRLQDLFALHPQALIQDMAVGAAIALVLLYFGLFIKRKNKSNLLFKKATEREGQDRKLLFPEKPLYFFSIDSAKVYYQKWKESLILVDHTSKLDILALSEMEKEADRYGYSLILMGFQNVSAADLREMGYYALREEKHIFFISQQLPQLEAKFLIKQLVRTTKKVVR